MDSITVEKAPPVLLVANDNPGHELDVPQVEQTDVRLDVEEGYAEGQRGHFVGDDVVSRGEPDGLYGGP